jgi:DNA repair photolyase
MSRSLLDVKNEDYTYAPLAYQDSWLSVDPIVGCRLNCQYCYMQATHWTATKPEHLYTMPEIVKMLISHRYFFPHETVLSFGNQTDPFLPDNIDYTLAFFEALASGLNSTLTIA